MKRILHPLAEYAAFARVWKLKSSHVLDNVFYNGSQIWIFFPNVASHVKELSIKEDVNDNADRRQTVRWHFECYNVLLKGS